MTRNVFERFGYAIVALAATAGAANADFTISARPTKNVTCSGGVCSTSGVNANLNVAELESMLAASDVKLVSSGKTENIVILVQLHWASASTLTLDAYRSVEIQARISVEGTAPGLTIVTSDGGKGGKLHFADKGRVTFLDLNSRLTIDGAAYTLVADVPTLSAEMHQQSDGNFALAANYDSSAHGTYYDTPIRKPFRGRFEGLGNTISNLEIRYMHHAKQTALFAEVDGVVRDIKLQKLGVVGESNRGPIYFAGLAGINRGLIQNAFVSGSVTLFSVRTQRLGGLVSQNFGTVDHCHTAVSLLENSSDAVSIGGLVADNMGTISNSSAAIEGALGRTSNQIVNFAGGIAATNSGTISASYATGTIDGGSDNQGIGETTGGVAGSNGGAILQSYAAVAVSGGSNANPAQLGGLVGLNAGTIGEVYSTGQVVPPPEDSNVGGLIGVDMAAAGSIANGYWDLDTSGITNPGQGAGSPANDPGITGLTDTQLKSSLPTGFDPNVWGQNPNINNGWPYLLANPPQ